MPNTREYAVNYAQNGIRIKAKNSVTTSDTPNLTANFNERGSMLLFLIYGLEEFMVVLFRVCALSLCFYLLNGCTNFQ